MDLTVENVLEIQDFQTEDLQRRFNCSVRNAKGFESRRAVLEEEGEAGSGQIVKSCSVWTGSERGVSSVRSVAAVGGAGLRPGRHSGAHAAPLRGLPRLLAGAAAALPLLVRH